MSEFFPEPNTFFSHPDWRSWADRLVWRGPEKPKAIIACSGGADSVFLACLIVFHYGELSSQRLRIVHVHHGLRGVEADGDADFARALAEWLGLSFRLVKLLKAPDDATPTEGELRDYRFKALEQQLREWGGSAIFLGHHQNDIAEGMLISMSRGSGLSGLSSPRPGQTFAYTEDEFKDQTYQRCHPLLGFSREEIESALNLLGMGWREDASNTASHYLRNRLRHRVVTEWIRSSEQDVLGGVATSRAYLEQADSALDWWLDSLNLDTANPDHLSGEPLRGLPLELWRRAFWRWINRWHSRREIRRKALDPFLQHWRAEGSFDWSIGPDMILKCRDGQLQCIRCTAPDLYPDYEVNWFLNSRLYLPDGKYLRAERIKVAEALKRIEQKQSDNGKEAMVSIHKEKIMQVSTWQSGDRMKPLGAPGERKLQDIFVDKKIPVEKRRQLPVIRHPKSRKILWAPGLPPAEAFKVTEDSKAVLWIRYR